MAKLKKSVRAKSSAGTQNADLQAKAEQMSRSIVESAQQIWMAGVGAFTRAQGEGSKLFEALVKEGMTIDQTTRKLATGKVDAVRDAVEDRVGVVRERAVDTWDRLENVFETRVQRALNPALELEGVLLTMVDERTNLSQQVIGEIRAHFKDKVFRSAIPRSVRLAEAPSFGKPILLYDIKSRGAEAYLELAKELMAHEKKGAGQGALRPPAGS